MDSKFLRNLDAKHVNYKDMSNGFSNQLLVNGDTNKLLKLLPDNSVDHVDIDVPYKLTKTDIKKLKKVIAEKHAQGKSASLEQNSLRLAHMSNGFPIEKVLTQLLRINKHVNMAIWCSHQQIQPILNFFASQHIKGLDWWHIVWQKTNDNHPLNGTFDYTSENCLIFYQKGYHLIHGRNCTKLLSYTTPANAEDHRFKISHPTIKLAFIYRNIIYSMTKMHDTVFDCYMGSGTSGVASKLCNRNYIGFEWIPEYYKIAVKRIQHSNRYNQNLINNEINHIVSDKYTKQQAIEANKYINEDMEKEAFAEFNNATSHSTVESMQKSASKPTRPTPTPVAQPVPKHQHLKDCKPSIHKHVAYSTTKQYKYNYNHSTKAKFRRKLCYIKKHNLSQRSKYHHYLDKYSRQELYRRFLQSQRHQPKGVA